MVAFPTATLSLAKEAITASAGSACASSDPEPSYVLRAMSVQQTAIHDTIRFSLGSYNTDYDIDYYILENLPPITPKASRILSFVV